MGSGVRDVVSVQIFATRIRVPFFNYRRHSDDEQRSFYVLLLS